MADFLGKNSTLLLVGLGLTAASAGVGYTIGRNLSSKRVQKKILFKAYENEANPLNAYIQENSLREPQHLKDIREATLQKCKRALMLVDPLESQFLRFLLKSINAKRCIEVGVFTGYNSCSMASALPDDGEVIACDITDECINIGKPFWDPAHAQKIKVKIGPAVETLDALLEEGQEGTFDFVFIDADKVNYDAYYERGLMLLRKGGIIGVDNALWGGAVLEDETVHDKDTRALHNLNKKIKNDHRVEISLLQLGDGTNLCMKL